MKNGSVWVDDLKCAIFPLCGEPGLSYPARAKVLIGFVFGVSPSLRLLKGERLNDRLGHGTSTLSISLERALRTVDSGPRVCQTRDMTSRPNSSANPSNYDLVNHALKKHDADIRAYREQGQAAAMHLRNALATHLGIAPDMILEWWIGDLKAPVFTFHTTDDPQKTTSLLDAVKLEDDGSICFVLAITFGTRDAWPPRRIAFKVSVKILDGKATFSIEIARENKSCVVDWPPSEADPILADFAKQITDSLIDFFNNKLDRLLRDPSLKDHLLVPEMLN